MVAKTIAQIYMKMPVFLPLTSIFPSTISPLLHRVSMANAGGGQFL